MRVLLLLCVLLAGCSAPPSVTKVTTPMPTDRMPKPGDKPPENSSPDQPDSGSKP